jgi:hypothetical protein
MLPEICPSTVFGIGLSTKSADVNKANPHKFVFDNRAISSAEPYALI